MTTCETRRTLTLDHAYGLLDGAEAAAFDAHLATCPACAAYRERALALVTRAAKAEFPNVAFDPAKPPTPCESAGPPALTVRAVCVRWAVAASLLLACTAVGGTGARDLVATLAYRPAVDRSFAALREAEAERGGVLAAVAAEETRLQGEKVAATRRGHEIAQTWMRAEVAVSAAVARRPFTLDIEGPATAVAGAPNEYRLKATDLDGKPKPVRFEASVKGADGRVLFTQAGSAAGASLKLPASIWAQVPAGTAPTLVVTATDPTGGAVASVTETVRLAEPLFATLLTTDKPMYRPGETLYYRSLTLDRTTFTPAARELNLRFAVESPDGQTVPGSEATGLAKPTLNGTDALPGPDGRPIRGLGTGAFALPPGLPGGEYTLKVFEMAPNDGQPRASAPLGVRRFLVNRYTPDRLEKTLEFDGKTYGPGDAVQAKFTARDQGKPLPGAPLNVTLSATLNGTAKKLALDVAPTVADANGDAAIKFTLPKGELSDVSLSVTARAAAVTETIVRRVPLATRKLTVEFFPEGGELVAGVPNRVYFRVTTLTGRPADLTGVLTDGTTTVTTLATLTDAERPGANQGLGSFRFTPQAGKSYHVTLRTPSGIEPPTKLGYPLPAAKADGVTLSIPDGVTRPGEPLRVQLQTQGPARNVVVGAYTRGRAMAHAKATLRPGAPTEVALDFGASKLGGVTRVTVFEAPADEADRADLQPIAERLVYRSPGEVLKIATATQRAGAFVPGMPVELTVTTADETGAPRAAVLWAAVVNRSVLTMADDKAARLLPTHFLLAGELQRPDELENADFLLTDHPQANAALDLVLGTQGWRRFAEQAPGEFRLRAPSEDTERLLTAMGAGRDVPLGWRAGSVKLFEEYWPKYEAAVADLNAAETTLSSGEYGAPFAPALAEATRRTTTQRHNLDVSGGQLWYYQASVEGRVTMLPLTLTLLLGLGVTLGLIRVLRGAMLPERRWLTRGAVGFTVLGAFLLTVAAVTYQGDRRWQSVVEKPSPYGQTFSKVGGKIAAAPMTMPTFGPMIPATGDDANSVARLPVTGARTGFLPSAKPADRLRPSQLLNPRPMMKPLTGEVFAGPGRMPPPLGVPIGQFQPQVGRPKGLLARFDDDLPDELVDRNAHSAWEAWRGIRAALPAQPLLVVREYAHVRPRPASDDEPRRDFTETLLWQPVIVTPADGRGVLKFDLADDVTAYQVLVAGHTLDGRLGASVSAIEVRKPFAVDLKLPQEIGSADKLSVPVQLTNATPESRTADGNLTLDGLKFDGPNSTGGFQLSLPAGGGGRAFVTVTPERLDGRLKVTAHAAAGNGLKDSVERTLSVVPDGFPLQGAASELLERSVTLPIKLPKQWIPGTLQASVVVYPNSLAEILGGLDGLLREPSGCFEQTSTTNYPNVLVLDYLRETNQARPEVATRARGLLERGYARLTGFECPQTGPDGRADGRVGFEWFGAADRPHEALSAYGLLQFTDMSRVHPVDPALLARTKKYLLDRRDGEGGFRVPANDPHAFGRAPAHVVDAYILWAVSTAEANSGDKSDLTKELDAAFARAAAADRPEAKDPYYLALVAGALLNRDRAADGVKLLQLLAKLQSPAGDLPGVATSITQSTGKSLAVEATALAALGWFRAGRPELFGANVQAAVRWVSAQRDASGAFGSTQATILALKALIEHARLSKRPAESGELRVLVSGAEVGKKAFSNRDAGPIVVAIPEAALLAGAGEVRVETTARESYPVSLTWSARTRQPDSSADCPVRLTTTLDRARLDEGETARLNATLTNVGDVKHGMLVAILGLPAGVKLPEDLKQLKALTERPKGGGEPTVSHFELRGREVVLYRRGLLPREALTLTLDVIADSPGTFRGPASRAYLYYGAEHKHWVAPLDVTVTAK